MTLFAGIVARDGAPLDDQIRRRLHASLSRHPLDKPVVFEGPHWSCAAVDIGAFPHPGHLFDGVTLSLLAGEPLRASASISQSAE